MYTFESGESKKPALPKKENPTIKKPAPRGEDDGYTFMHHVDTFGDDMRPEEKASDDHLHD